MSVKENPGTLVQAPESNMSDTKTLLTVSFSQRRSHFLLSWSHLIRKGHSSHIGSRGTGNFLERPPDVRYPHWSRFSPLWCHSSAAAPPRPSESPLPSTASRSLRVPAGMRALSRMSADLRPSWRRQHFQRRSYRFWIVLSRLLDLPMAWKRLGSNCGSSRSVSHSSGASGTACLEGVAGKARPG